MKKHPLSIAIGFALLATAGNSLAADGSTPPTPAPKPQYYTVQKGDTLGGIALEFYGRSSAFRRIYEANLDILKSPDLIFPDQVLLLPLSDDRRALANEEASDVSATTPPEDPLEPDPPPPLELAAVGDERVPPAQPEALEPEADDSLNTATTYQAQDSVRISEPSLAQENLNLSDSIAELESEIDQLKAENEGLKAELAETHARLSAVLNQAQNRTPQDLGTPSVGGAYQFRTPPESALGEEFYRRGVEALSRNEPAEAVRLFLLAAAEANPKSMNALGNLYMRGHGTIPSAREAYIWFLRASELGHATAMKNLAKLYESGNGVRASDDKASYWTQLAASVEAGEASLATK
jgi:uncharacterized small protein (DUF1192 family)